ncbi:MAG: hypothetical protein KVP17_002474 [Porospora cf. gigantea B]|uniref:uncharacterized protein n=1 Tax=Porospora cf. gigantea B TaxID=2853592 RepID=UPI003571A98E|nr:MAG: hypothetical protein KVP17_002474 [Porospora cf. gigantea B]
MAHFRKLLDFFFNAVFLALTSNTVVQLDILREIAMRSRVLVDSVGDDYDLRYHRLTEILVFGLASSLASLSFCVYVLSNFGYRLTAVIGHLMHTFGVFAFFKGRELPVNVLGTVLLGTSCSLIFNGHSMMSKLLPERYEVPVQHFQSIMSNVSLVAPALMLYIGEWLKSTTGQANYNSLIIGYVFVMNLLTPVVFLTSKSHKYPKMVDWNVEEDSSDGSDAGGPDSNVEAPGIDRDELQVHEPHLLLGSALPLPLPQKPETYPFVPMEEFDYATKNWRNQVRSLPFLICALYMFNVNFRRAYFLANFREICFDFLRKSGPANNLQMFYNYVSVLGFLGTMLWALCIEISVQLTLWISVANSILFQLLLCFPNVWCLRASAVLFAFYNTNIYIEIYYVVTEFFGKKESNFLQGILFAIGGLGCAGVYLWNQHASVFFRENWLLQNWLVFVSSLATLALPLLRLKMDRDEYMVKVLSHNTKYV